MIFMKYVRRKFISPETHSSAYVMCYHNEKCMNKGFLTFLRIADCHKAFCLEMQWYSKKDLNRFFDRIDALLSFKLKRFVFKEYEFVLKQPSSEKSSLFINDYEHKKRIVRLHKDGDTCTEVQWRRKLSVLRTEINLFRDYLQVNNII